MHFDQVLIAFTALIPISGPSSGVRWEAFDLYGKSETGNFIYYSISSAAADRGKSNLSSCCG